MSLNAYAQTFQGKVVGAEGKPIAKVSVIISDAEKDPIAFTVTGRDGLFNIKLEKVSVTAAYILFSAVNYEKREMPLREYKNGMTVQLTDKAIELKEVKVTNQRIKEQGDTLTYSVMGFRQKQDRVIEDVIKRMPGLDVRADGQITYQGVPINKFYIEDMDLMGRQYAQASRNLSADKVESVQVFENHQSVKALQGVEKSNSPALNIVLRDDSKNVWTGNVDIGLGYTFPDENKLAYDGRLTGMLFTSKSQSLSLYKTNNIGLGYESEVSGAAGYATRERGLLKNISNGMGMTLEQNSRGVFNNSHLITTNWLFKTRKNTNLKLQLSALFDKTRAHHESETHYVDMADSVIRTEVSDSRAYRNEINGNLLYEVNSRKWFINNTLDGHVNFNHSDAYTLLNGIGLREMVKPRERHISDHLKMSKQLGNGNAIIASTSFSYSYQPGKLLLYNENIEELNLEGLMWEGQANYLHQWKYLQFRYMVKAYSHYQDLDVNTPDTTARNQYWENAIELSPSVSSYWGAFHIHITPAVKWFSQSFEHKHQRQWLFEPQISIYYNANGTFSHSISYAQHYSLSSIRELTSIPIYYNCTYLSTGSGSMDVSKMQITSYSTRYKNIGARLFANIALQYLCLSNKLIYQNELVDGIYKRTLCPYDNHTANYGINGEIKKNFFWGNTSVALGGSYSLTRYNTYQNHSIEKIKICHTDINFSFSSRPLEFLSVEGNARIMRSHNGMRNSFLSNSTIVDYRGNINVNLFFNNWMIMLKNSLFDNNQKYASTNYFSDIKLSYKRKTYEITLDCYNLWNNNQLINSYIDMFESVYSINRLHPREIIAGIHFNF